MNFDEIDKGLTPLYAMHVAKKYSLEKEKARKASENQDNSNNEDNAKSSLTDISIQQQGGNNYEDEGQKEDAFISHNEKSKDQEMDIPHNKVESQKDSVAFYAEPLGDDAEKYHCDMHKECELEHHEDKREMEKPHESMMSEDCMMWRDETYMHYEKEDCPCEMEKDRTSERHMHRDRMSQDMCDCDDSKESVARNHRCKERMTKDTYWRDDNKEHMTEKHRHHERMCKDMHGYDDNGMKMRKDELCEIYYEIKEINVYVMFMLTHTRDKRLYFEIMQIKNDIDMIEGMLYDCCATKRGLVFNKNMYGQNKYLFKSHCLCARTLRNKIEIIEDSLMNSMRTSCCAGDENTFFVSIMLLGRCISKLKNLEKMC